MGPGGWREAQWSLRNEDERFILLLGEKKKERVWERKGRGVEPDRSLADFCFSVFFVFFSAPFLEAPFSVFFLIFESFRGPWGGHFSTFLHTKTVFSWKGGTLVFAHPYSVLARFWGSGTSWGVKKREKTAPGKACFFELKRKVSEFVFSWF